MITIETPTWISKQPKCQNPRSNKQTNKQIEEISHENSNATSEKSFSQICSCIRPVRTLEYN